MKARVIQKFDYDMPVLGGHGAVAHHQGVVQDEDYYDEFAATIGMQEKGLLEKDHKYGLYQRGECVDLLRKNSAKLGPYPDNGYNPYRGAVVGLKNGNCFIDGGLNVIGKDGIKRNFMTLTIYCDVDDTVWDDVNGYTGMNVYEYIEMLKKNNPKLRMDMTMFIGTPWTDEAAKLFDWLSIRR